MPKEQTPILASDATQHKSAWLEWFRWGLTGMVIPLAVFLVDLRQSSALQAAEIHNLRVEIQSRADANNGRIDRMDVQQRAMDNLLARLDATIQVVKDRLDELATPQRRGR